jgi:hypothetical protein
MSVAIADAGCGDGGSVYDMRVAAAAAVAERVRLLERGAQMRGVMLDGRTWVGGTVLLVGWAWACSVAGVRTVCVVLAGLQGTGTKPCGPRRHF